MKIQRLLVIVAFSILHICGYGQIEYEGTHDDGLKSFQLDNGDIKYARYFKSGKTLTLYNIDRTEWKTVQLTIPKRQSFDDLKSITVNVFNADTLLELAYTCVEYSYNNDIEVSSDNVDIHYTLFIVNEEGKTVFEAENGNEMKIVDSNSKRKLLVYKQIEQGRDIEKQIDVYALPYHNTAIHKRKQLDENSYFSSGPVRGI